MMSEIERKLSLILVDHDVAIGIREEMRTDTVWPDKSDIQTYTRQRIMALFESGEFEEEAHMKGTGILCPTCGKDLTREDGFFRRCERCRTVIPDEVDDRMRAAVGAAPRREPAVRVEANDDK